MRYTLPKKELFIQNRKSFAREMKKNSLAVFVSNPVVTRSADASYKWRQNPDLFYLSGIDQEETYLILFPDAPEEKFREMLFVRKTNEHIMVWEGKKHTQEEAATISGIQQVQWSDSFQSVFTMLMHYADRVYLNLNEHDRSISMGETGEMEFARYVLKNFPLHKTERSAPILHGLRSAKSTIETDLLKQAIEITNKGFLRALKFIKPGVSEFEIEAELIHEYIRNRASGFAYEPIVASGENACVLHYTSNDAVCKKGELVLMDCAAEYANYNADLTRTVPVSGKFTKRQKDVYNSVLYVHNQAKTMMRSGIVLQDLNKEVGLIMQSELVKLKLLTKNDIKNQNQANPAYKRFFPHGTAHFLGLDVHDVGNRYEKLKPGVVLTCEPGIYIREEKLGIRLENNIVVTKDAPIDLMQHTPIEADEIEELMNTK